jgi:hypothetical protein
LSVATSEKSASGMVKLSRTGFWRSLGGLAALGSLAAFGGLADAAALVAGLAAGLSTGFGAAFDAALGAALEDFCGPAFAAAFGATLGLGFGSAGDEAAGAAGAAGVGGDDLRAGMAGLLEMYKQFISLMTPRASVIGLSRKGVSVADFTDLSDHHPRTARNTPASHP